MTPTQEQPRLDSRPPSDATLVDIVHVAEEIAIGTPPNSYQVAELATRGFRSIVDLRPLSERDAPTSACAEEAVARRARLAYVRLAFPRNDELALACQADDFRQALDCIPHPVYVHSRRGAKAAAFAIIWLALRHGWTGTHALELVDQWGLPCNQPRLRQFIAHYVNVREMSRFVVAGAVVD